MTKKKDNKEKNVSSVVVDEKLIDSAVVFINETANKTIYKGSIEIGEYILKNFFENNIKLAASKNPKKLASFNKLCEREDLVVHPNRLGLMVRVASQERFLAEKKIDVESLSYTHKASLVKLKDDQDKIRTIKKCVDEKWTTRKLDTEITKRIENLLSTQKPSLIRNTLKYISKVDDVLKAAEDSNLEISDDELSKMSDKRRKDLENYLKELKTKIDDTVKKSDGIKTGCDGLLTKLAQVAEEKKANPPKPGRKKSKGETK